ncbi:MAG: diadenylate cyclase CdaA [Polyangiaceae bacterium]
MEWLRRALERPWFEILRDIADIIAVAIVIYRVLLLVRGTRAMQMAVGLLFFLLLYLAAKFFNLVTLLNLLGYVLSSIILIVVVVFQNDIRRALIRAGGQAWFGRGRKREQSRVIDEVVAAVTELARHRIGALITFEQDANLLEFTKSEGTVIGAAVTRELLVTLFYPESVNKLHDGAVIIRDLKIARAGVFFPMPDVKIQDKSLGSRHRAAIGITEETDAVVVVVSEERGTISFCFNGNIVPNLDGTALRQTLVGLLGQKAPPAPKSVAPPSSGPPTRREGPLTTPIPGHGETSAKDGHSERPERASLPPRRMSSPELPHHLVDVDRESDVPSLPSTAEVRHSVPMAHAKKLSLAVTTPLPKDTAAALEGKPTKASRPPVESDDGPLSDRPAMLERAPRETPTRASRPTPDEDRASGDDS